LNRYPNEDKKVKEINDYKLNNLSILYAKLHDKNFKNAKLKQAAFFKSIIDSKPFDLNKDNVERLKKINKKAKDDYRKIFHTIDIQDKLFKTNLEYEPSPIEKHNNDVRKKRINDMIVRNTMFLEGEVFIEDKEEFEKQEKFELMKEINSVENLDWMIRKMKTMKHMNKIKNIS